MDRSTRRFHWRRILSARRCSQVVPVRTASAGASTEPLVLGCSVVRSLTDDRWRAWRVREQRVTADNFGTTRTAQNSKLVFTCEEPAVPPELRRSRTPLEALADGDLLQLLTCGC